MKKSSIIKFALLGSIFAQATEYIGYRATRDFGNWTSREYSAIIEDSKVSIEVGNLFAEVYEEVTLKAPKDDIQGDPNSLEFIGSFNMVPGTQLRSFLLWNNDTILKAKLKEDEIAKLQYEAVVQRDEAIERPRDPAIFSMGDYHNYDYLIYPVKAGGLRKLRLRYSVPLSYTLAGKSFKFNPVFAGSYAASQPEQLPVEVVSSGKIVLEINGNKKQILSNSTYMIDSEELAEPYYYYYYEEQTDYPTFWVGDSIPQISLKQSVNGSNDLIGEYTYLAVQPITKVDSLVKTLQGKWAIDLKVAAGEKTYISPVQSPQDLVEVLLKTKEAWDGQLTWIIYDENGLIVEEVNHAISEPEHNSELLRYWASKRHASGNETDLGALLGFVDRRMSLVALEEDKLALTEVPKYKNSGVPLLNASDIFIDKSKLNDIPETSVVFYTQTPDNATTAITQKALFPFDYSIQGNQIQLNFQETVKDLNLTWVNASGQKIVQKTYNGVSQITLDIPSSGISWLNIDYKGQRYAIRTGIKNQY